ncbi:hypothetical protein [Marinimicrobium sp. ARAG 43.8]|uniref:hypothetical protein n=1 Tax=Marinimicrobium sp. ARAG 43.8 TaxID=3418719 RepID=UPI003CFB0BF6
MKNIVFLLSVSIAAVGGYWVGKSSHNGSPRTEARQVIVDELSSAPDSASPSHPVAKKFINQASDIKNTYGNCKASGDELCSHERVDVAVSSEQSTQEKIDAIKEDYEFRRRSDLFTSWVLEETKNNFQFDIGHEVNERFSVEEIDYDWAYDAEGSLQSMFTQEQDLSGVAMKSTVCKSTACQIVIGVVDVDHASDSADLVIKTLSETGFSHIVVDNQIDKGETTFYVSRSEKGFELN